MFKVLLGFMVIATVGFLIFMMNPINSTSVQQNQTQGIRYVAIGDSYTIGEGALESESWPNILTEHLKKDGIEITLVANPSVTGWTTQDVLDKELAIYDASNPTFATLLIGVNDWVRGVDTVTFQKNLQIIIDHMQKKLPDKSKLILVTIPDFSAAPSGQAYSNGRDISKGLAEFNAIITQEGRKRNLSVVDIYPVSQKMATDPELVALDGLHPSAKEYAVWETLIYPVAYKMLSEN